MLSIACFLIFTAFFTFYLASAKIKATSPAFLQKRISANRLICKMAAMTLLVVALGILITTQGIGAGTLYFFIALMMLGSMTILLAPLQLFSLRNIIPLFLLCLLAEYFLTY